MQQHSSTFDAARRPNGYWLFFPGLSLLAAALQLLPLPAAAGTEDEIQVYNNSINAPGQLGLELHSNFVAEGTRTPAWKGDASSNGSWRETSEFSYGLTKNWEAGAYLPVL